MFCLYSTLAALSLTVHCTVYNALYSVQCTVQCTIHCPKSNPNFRDITWNVEENEILHEIFRVVSRFPCYISCSIAENRLPLGQCTVLVHNQDTMSFILICTVSNLNFILDTAYLYPDLSTALVGRWQGGQLVSARPARLRSWEEVEGIMVPAFQFTARTEFR